MKQVLLYPHWSAMGCERCRSIKTSNGHNIPWVTSFRYLGTYIVGGRTLQCSTIHVKWSFHRAINAIFGKTGILTSEEVILELVKNKMYTVFVVWIGVLCFAKKWLEIVRLCWRMIFNEIIQNCKQRNYPRRSFFKFSLPNQLLEKSRVKFESNFMQCTCVLQYSGIKT